MKIMPLPVQIPPQPPSLSQPITSLPSRILIQTKEILKATALDHCAIITLAHFIAGFVLCVLIGSGCHVQKSNLFRFTAGDNSPRVCDAQ